MAVTGIRSVRGMGRIMRRVPSRWRIWRLLLELMLLLLPVRDFRATPMRQRSSLIMTLWRRGRRSVDWDVSVPGRRRRE